MCFFMLGSGKARFPLGTECELLLSSVLVAVASVCDAKGRAEFSLPIPNNPSSAGFKATCQWAVVDPGGPVAGVVGLSAGLAFRIGK